MEKNKWHVGMKKKYVQCFISFIDDGRSKETQQFFHFGKCTHIHTHVHTL